MSLVKKSIGLAKGKFPFRAERISIGQTFAGHHTFEILAVVAKDEDCSVNMLRQVLGEYIQVSFASVEHPGRENKFLGFVDSITPVRTGGRLRVKINGYSPTILMDAGPAFRTFTQQSSKAIFEKITGNYEKGWFPGLNCSALAEQVFYTVQNQETDYRYLCRLADACESLFWYDGQHLNFGDLDGAKVELDIKTDLLHVEASVNLCPLRFHVRGYNSVKNEVHVKPHGNLRPGLGQLSKYAVEKSACYEPLRIGMSHGIREKEDLDGIERQLMSRQTNDLLTVRGSSSNPAIRVGTLLSFGGGDVEVLPGISEGEQFRVVEVNHHISSGNNYQNSFVAVPSDHPFPLNMPQMPALVCGPLVAKVIENNDGESLGRVKVQFLMDLEKNTSPWVKVLVPFASNDGCFFLPEVGEKVLVFFEDFNPEKMPFVLGSFYHGGAKATAWSDPKNKKKGWKTAKTAFILDDNTGELVIRASSIRLEAESDIRLSTHSNGKLSMESPDIKLAARDKMELSGGTHLKQKAVRIDIN